MLTAVAGCVDQSASDSTFPFGSRSELIALDHYLHTFLIQRLKREQAEELDAHCELLQQQIDHMRRDTRAAWNKRQSKKRQAVALWSEVKQLLAQEAGGELQLHQNLSSREAAAAYMTAALRKRQRHSALGSFLLSPRPIAAPSSDHLGLLGSDLTAEPAASSDNKGAPQPGSLASWKLYPRPNDSGSLSPAMGFWQQQREVTGAGEEAAQCPEFEKVEDQVRTSERCEWVGEITVDRLDVQVCRMRPSLGCGGEWLYGPTPMVLLKRQPCCRTVYNEYNSPHIAKSLFSMPPNPSSCRWRTSRWGTACG